ncbi:MAG: hypothetical protein K8W52_27645 [Deltaproteobacteria bacterium]|nr:hypothetical protein [Deltaproteobacteria bacterium]
MSRALTIALVLVAAPAVAEPMAVVVRAGSGDTALAVARLRGQLADLDLAITDAPGRLEPSLDAQFATAARLAEKEQARAVVWFIARDGGIAVAVATPADHRLFVRVIPPAEPSTVAEAAAVAARGALRAIALGGSIGVEVPPPPPVVVPAMRPQGSLEVALGWQLALDGGADGGAHALAERTMWHRGAWAGGLAIAFGPPRPRHDVNADLELSRTGAALVAEWRAGGFAIGLSAGAILYRRTTIATDTGLAATPGATTVAFGGGPALRWHWRPRHLPLGIEAGAGLDVVLGAPTLAISRAGTVQSLGAIRVAQPWFGLSVIAGLP